MGDGRTEKDSSLGWWVLLDWDMSVLLIWLMVLEMAVGETKDMGCWDKRARLQAHKWRVEASWRRT